MGCARRPWHASPPSSQIALTFLALGFGTLDVDELEESDLAGLGTEALRLFDCLNPEEVYQVLTLPAASGQ